MSEINYAVGETKHSIHRPGSPASGTETLAAGVIQLQERIDAENAAKSTTEILLDNSNEVSFPGFPYKFEALGEKILVSIDVFKSGYECRKCKGKKSVHVLCNCEENGHAGVKYGKEELQTIEESLGKEVANARVNMPCPECNGDYVSLRRDETCPECKGLGALLHLPDNSKNLPTTGVVVSMGSSCDPEKLRFKAGDRILFGPYAGSMIPTKAGLMFKILDASQAWCKIKGGEDLAAFDFIIQDN